MTDAPDIPLLRADTARLADAVDAAAARFADTLASAPDPTARAGTLEWTVHELGAHLATGSESYAAMVAGRPTPLTDMARRADVGAAAIAGEAATSDTELAERVRAGSADLAATLRASAPADPLPFYGTHLPASVLGGVFLAELLVHGHDLARIPVPVDAAVMAGPAALPLLPLVLKPGTPERVSLAFRVRSHGELFVVVDGDRATVRSGVGGPVDARLSAEPVTFLLACYERINPLAAMLRGRLSVTGRRPWRLNALKTRFDTA